MAESEGIQKRMNEFTQHFNNRAMDQCGEILTDDVEVFFPESETTIGIEDYLKRVEEHTKRGLASVIYHVREKEYLSPDFAFDMGDMHCLDCTGTVIAVNPHLILWKRICGKWYIYRAMYHTLPGDTGE